MTRELKLYEMKHHMKDALDQSDLVVSQYTDKDLANYETEWNIMNTHRSADTDICSESREALSQEVIFNFGKYSKEDKYFDRMVRNGDTKAAQHYGQYPLPKTLADKIATAKENVENMSIVSATVGVAEKTVDDIDSAISYLLKEGFTFGSDFNAHNAVDIARSNVNQSLVEGKPTNIIWECESCENCDSMPTNVSTQYLNNERMMCECGNKEMKATIRFKDNKVFIMDKHTIGE